MPWIILLLSACLEAVWATSLDASEGLKHPIPSAIFAVTIVLSTITLAYAAKHIPIGVAYAVWTGLGASLTIAWAVISGVETLTFWRGFFLCGIILSVVALKFVNDVDKQKERIAATDSKAHLRDVDTE